MKKITSIFLSFLLLFSSMGFTVSTHFCGGHAVASVLDVGNQNLDCGMMEMKQEHTDHEDGKVMLNESPCCLNTYAVYDLEEAYSTEATSIDVSNTFLFAFIFTYLSTRFNESENKSAHICYDSPPRLQDIPVLNQSFLI